MAACRLVKHPAHCDPELLPPGSAPLNPGNIQGGNRLVVRELFPRPSAADVFDTMLRLSQRAVRRRRTREQGPTPWPRATSSPISLPASSAAPSSRRCSPCATRRRHSTSCRMRCCGSPKSTRRNRPPSCHSSFSASCRTPFVIFFADERFARSGRRCFRRLLRIATTTIRTRWKLWKPLPVLPTTLVRRPRYSRHNFLIRLTRRSGSCLPVNARRSSFVTGKSLTLPRPPPRWGVPRAA